MITNIVFNEASHRYFIDKKGIPSVTAILSFVGKPMLLAWLRKHPEEFINQETEKALSIGDQVHKAIETLLKEKDVDIDTKFPDELKAGIKAFKIWQDTVKLEPLYLETPIASIQYQYAGKPDFIGKVDGRISLCDWKTSKAIYPEYKLQLIAYRQAALETFNITIEDLYIGRFDKLTGLPEIVKIDDDYDYLMKVFLSVKELYTFIKINDKK